MDAKTMQDLKTLLEAKKQEIIVNLESIGHRSEGAETNYDANFPNYDDSASIEDNAAEVIDYDRNVSLEHNLEDELRSVEKALKRIEEGTYGKCSYCGQEIESERLKIRPESTSCVNCKKTLKGQG